MTKRNGIAKARPSRRATILDVARRAEVSTATVSRTLTDPDRVAEPTLSRVIAAIRETGYTPNATARNLRAQSTKMVLCLLPGLGHSFWNVIIDAVEEVLTNQGYGVIFGDTRNDPVREAHYDRIVRAGQVDGVLLFNGRLPGTDFLQLNSKMPITLISNDIPSSGLPVFEVANRDAARAMTAYLIAVGHRRVAHITGPKGNVETGERITGYCDGLGAAGISVDDSLIWPGAFNFTAGTDAARRFLKLGADRPTAIFAASDEMAIGFIKGVKDAGIRVPADVSVAGFDGIEYSANFDPALTTMIQPRTEMGLLGAENLVARMSGRPADLQGARLPCSLAIRESVAPLDTPRRRTAARRSRRTGHVEDGSAAPAPGD
ncbi:MAG: LacI family DNA-binding transcriptional regulator [Bauldia sp.]|uniref:LacI family DNA-binding transcriptional regulator n=1 Tax=Bauldia sp. TaxID=2575872 RepID=UPI001D7EEFC6|nr:LacI family DNA-binding transcriptional regulator [Bauldia sp.]MCB1497724.1 LacI family DNA-binding transcriptional regulator [Bauldia sp.]